MAIQVNGTTVIDNSRNLTNIASVDATTVAALGAAGVGGAGWTSAGSTYTTNYYSIGTTNNTVDTGWLNISSIISNLPADYELLFILGRPQVTYNGSLNHSNFFYFYEADGLRVGSNSSNYQTFADSSAIGGSSYTNANYGFTGKYGYIGGTNAGQYSYEKQLGGAAIIGTAETAPNVPALSATFYTGNSLTTGFSHIINFGNLIEHSSNNQLEATYGANVGYLAWRRYNTAASTSTGSASGFAFRYVFSAAYYK